LDYKTLVLNSRTHIFIAVFAFFLLGGGGLVVDLIPEAAAQVATEQPGYSDGEKRRIARARTNRADPNLSVDKRLRHGGKKSGFLGLFRRLRRPNPNTENYNFSGDQQAGAPDDKFDTPVRENYRGNDQVMPPEQRNRLNRGGLGWEGNGVLPPLANYNLMRDIEKDQGEGRAPNARRERRRRERNMNYSGGLPGGDAEDKFDTSHPSNYSGNGYNPPPSKAIMDGIQNFAPDQPTFGANGVIIEGISKYSGETRVENQRRRWRRVARNMNYSGNQPARTPEDKFDTPYEEGYAQNLYIPGPNRDIVEAIAEFAPTAPTTRANAAIMERIRNYQGEMDVMDPDRRRKQLARYMNYSGEMRAIDPKERYREPGGPEGWGGDTYVGPRFNASIQKAISEYAPSYPKARANEYTLGQINDYTAYHTIRTEKAQARHYQQLTRKSAEYLGDYPIRVRRRKGIDGHPTEMYRLGRGQATQERANKIRRFNIFWNRLFKRNIQPDVFKKRQRRPGYDREEAEWWERLDQPNSVDPAEGGESDTGN